MPAFSDDLLAAARAQGTATLHEAAGRIGALPGAIKPVAPAMRLAGPAFTVEVPAGDNLAIHRALYAAEPGDVLVVATRGGIEWGYWGEILNEAAMALGLGGLVIDGGVRDTHVLAEQLFPVFSNGVCIRGTLKGIAPYALGRPIAIGDVVIRPGDLIVGDRDGVLVLPPEAVEAAVEKGRQREADEADKIAKLRAGARTLDLYGLGER
ncbi:4-hydroxy-4-methyl-2-oxoglutarate aldolase [Sphingosinicella sp. LHD-64]|uniref:RraA family protein n=1 Tax=Sphingosinicella sp. LHD-64 TaxID=3072139 RepID=UPI00280D5B3A|nr:4-hydroxy-4-methyl-2-oxoglutarate aldolase [Sphingosinicella sp. LHD-64]MDQ8756528.1 4-hydroxy-4-methyl-2-oxoglutarate aldolase [Sphingosinicella sp. LHD-64]